MGVDPPVKTCSKCAMTKSLSEFYATVPGQVRGDCKECVKHRRKQNYDPAKSRSRQAAKYGLTTAQAELFWEAKTCEICGSEDPQHPTGSFSIDHNHTTGVVRGALCSWCNWGLGHFQDNPQLLREAASYLERYDRLSNLPTAYGVVPGLGGT